MFIAYIARECREVVFDHHDTFAAYLQVWQECGYAIEWQSAKCAYIGTRATSGVAK